MRENTKRERESVHVPPSLSKRLVMPLWKKGFDHLERVVTDKPGCLIFQESPVFQKYTVERHVPVATEALNALAIAGAIVAVFPVRLRVSREHGASGASEHSRLMLDVKVSA